MRWLDEYVVGQEEAKKALIQVVINGLFNVYRDQGALGAVFLAWPTGVGKTELARSLARTLFGDSSAFTLITAQTMSHPADIAQLVGSSAGYIGYGDTPEMSDIRIHAGYKTAKEKKKLHPLIRGYNAENFSIVLVDEVEKAHPDIPNAFLWAIQSGEMKMSAWKDVDSKIKHSKMTDLRNTIFIFTSNVGEHKIASSKKNIIWFSSSNTDVRTWDKETFLWELRKSFAPEFIWRMDEIVRCHDLTQVQLRQVFNLHAARMNKIMEDKTYFTSLRVWATREYVDSVILGAKWIEYGARAIVPAIKSMGALTGIAIESWRIPKDANGILEFDMKDGAPILTFLNRPTGKHKKLTQESPQLASMSENTKTLVEWKINKFGDQVRTTAQTYLKLIAGYDPSLADTCRILERRLQWYGFNRKNLQDLQAIAFVSIYQSMDMPENGDILIRDQNMFGSPGFRAIEKYLRAAIIKSFSLEEIYQTICVLLKRPMTKNEALVISQHIHRLLQWKSQN